MLRFGLYLGMKVCLLDSFVIGVLGLDAPWVIVMYGPVL